MFKKHAIMAQKARKYDLSNSNIAGLGSDLEKKIKEASAAQEPGGRHVSFDLPVPCTSGRPCFTIGNTFGCCHFQPVHCSIHNLSCSHCSTAWQGLGKQPSLNVWRVEKFQVDSIIYSPISQDIWLTYPTDQPMAS